MRGELNDMQLELEKHPMDSMPAEVLRDAKRMGFSDARLAEMTRLDLPVLAGPSRKSFLAKADLRGTEFATAAGVAAAILGGAHLVRVHDVVEMKAVAEVADAILRAGAQTL